MLLVKFVCLRTFLLQFFSIFCLKRTRDGFSVLGVGNLNLNPLLGIIMDRYLAPIPGKLNILDAVYITDLKLLATALSKRYLTDLGARWRVEILHDRRYNGGLESSAPAYLDGMPDNGRQPLHVLISLL